MKAVREFAEQPPASYGPKAAPRKRQVASRTSLRCRAPHLIRGAADTSIPNSRTIRRDGCLSRLSRRRSTVRLSLRHSGHWRLSFPFIDPPAGQHVCAKAVSHSFVSPRGWIKLATRRGRFLGADRPRSWSVWSDLRPVRGFHLKGKGLGTLGSVLIDFIFR